VIAQLPAPLAAELAQRRRRFQHYLWHRVRECWPRLTEGERRAVCDINPGWAPPRPALDAAGRPLRDNESGEDFLFMHRQMIRFADRILARAADASCARVEGWRRVPPPGDTAYPVPEFPDSELEEVKSPAYFVRFVARWERQYTDPAYLASVTLGQLGSDLEFTICHDMHVRWAAPSPVGYRQPARPAHEISEQWDAPAYDYLGDTYSSHVNPLFWKIHGWADERVEDWKRAHAVVGDIGWRGTWVGPREFAGGGATPEEACDEMQSVDRVISASAAAGIDGFYRQVPRALRSSGQTPPRSTRP